jgi:hypothetical protein
LLPIFVFTAISVLWAIFCGWCCGYLADAGQFLILVSNIAYGLSLLGLSMFFLLSSACFAYGLLFILGPLNLLIAAVSFILGCIPSVIGGFFAVICFCIGGGITCITQIITWLYNSVVVTVVELGAGLGGLFALEAPASIVRGLVGFLMLVLGGLLALTGFGLPLGIPMIIFGIIMVLTGFIWGIPTSIYTFCAQCTGIQNLLAAVTALVSLVMDALDYAYGVGVIWMIAELLVYVGDIFVGGANFLAWFLWISCTSSLCVCALAPWGIAIPSCIASIPFSPCYALGFLMDCASWCFLILQNTLFYLWQFFFQSSMD